MRHTFLILGRATIAILYRPYVLGAVGKSTFDSSEKWQRNAIRRAREAAACTNSLLESLIELDAIKYLKPMMYAHFHCTFELGH